jgi:hypothetical protein
MLQGLILDMMKSLRLSLITGETQPQSKCNNELYTAKADTKCSAGESTKADWKETACDDVSFHL